MMKLAACGNKCDQCPRYQATVKQDRQGLGEVAELWHRCGWRETVEAPEAMLCSGCTPALECRHGILNCQRERQVSTCAACSMFPLCGRLHAMLGKAAQQEKACRSVCSEKELKGLDAAFFSKWVNLDKARQEMAKTLALDAGDQLLAGYRILISEDDEDLLQAMRFILEGAGAKVEGHQRGHETLAALEACKPHLLTTDIMKPGMDGFELIEIIKKERGLQLPVVIVSARVGMDSASIARGFCLGVDDILVKPFEPLALLLCLKGVLERRGIRP